MVILKFKDNKTNNVFELQVKKGNQKPISKDTYIISMQSGYFCSNINCNMHRVNSGNCYTLKYECNKLFMKNTLLRRLKDELTIDYLVKNDMYKELANKLIKASNRSKEYSMKYLRFNESGEIKNIDYLIFVNNLSEILYKKLGVITTIYTHREDIYKQFKDNYTQSKGLIILGSGFNANIQFKAVKTLDKNYKYVCISNCIECKKIYSTALCYNKDLKDKGIIIKEKLRTNDNKIKSFKIPKDIIKQLTEINNYYKGV